MSECARCGKSFQCGMVDADPPTSRSSPSSPPCWCTTLPPLPAGMLGRDAPGCYCPDCLRALVASLAGTHGDAGIA